MTNKQNKSEIKCSICKAVFQIPDEGFQTNHLAKSALEKIILNGKSYQDELTDFMRRNFKELNTLHEQQIEKYAELEVAIFDHFSGIRRDIDLRGELLKEKIGIGFGGESLKEEIDISVHEMIEQVKDKEESFKKRLLQFSPSNLDIEQEKSLANTSQPFRHPVLIKKKIYTLKKEHSLNTANLEKSLRSFNSMKKELGDIKFIGNSSNVRGKDFFGKLILDNEIDQHMHNIERYGYDPNEEDDPYEDSRDYGNYYDSEKEDYDYTACSADGCGYCGHCDY